VVIVAAGITPAWQQIIRLPRLIVGEVNRAIDVHWCGSGKVLNVGLALHHLGASSLTLAPLGGQALQAIEAEFSDLGVPHHWIPTHGPTRVCTTVLDTATSQTTELVENAAPLSSDELSAYFDAFRESISRATAVVLSGSLPRGTPTSFYRDLLELARRHASALPCVIDARGAELLAALDFRPLVVKPNREELGLTFGKKLDDEPAIREAIDRLLALGATWVVMTQGRDTVWVASQTCLERFQPPVCETVVNPIGCGDCLAAGIAVGLARGWEVPRAVQLGISAAVENLGQLLPARLDAAAVETRLPTIHIAR
jgi:1-phosphofructokinase family hexose kinase